MMRGALRLGILSAMVAAMAWPVAAADFTIGVAAPLGGPDAVFGNQIRLGVEQAVADLNGVGGFDGRQGRVAARDDGNDPKKAAAIAEGFVAAGTRVVIGHLSSAATLPASAIYAAAGDIDVAPAALAPALTDRGLATVFRTCGRDDEQASVATQFLLARHYTRVAVAHDRTSAGKTLADAVRQALGKAGVRDVVYGSVDKGRDAAVLAARIKASGAQVVFFGGGGTEAGMLLRQLRDADARTVLLGGASLAADDFPLAAGAAADGALMVFPPDPRSRPAAADLLRRLRRSGIEPEAGVFYAYAAVQVVGQAMAAVHSADPARIAAAMHDGRTFKTVLGDLSFDGKGDPKTPDFAVYAWHKGASGRMTFDEPARP